MIFPPDDLDELCRAARREEEPSENDRRLVRSRLARQIGVVAGLTATTMAGSSAAASATSAVGLAGSSAAAVAATSAKVSLVSVALSLAAGAGLGTAVTVLSLAVASEPDPTRDVPVAAASAAKRSSKLEPRQTQPPSRPDTAASSEPKLPPTTAASPLPVTRSDATPSLEHETRALAAVQRALRDGRAADALLLLDDADVLYRNGALGIERSAARVLALCEAGQGEAARTAAARFLRDHPASPLVPRVSAACRK